MSYAGFHHDIVTWINSKQISDKLAERLNLSGKTVTDLGKQIHRVLRLIHKRSSIKKKIELINKDILKSVKRLRYLENLERNIIVEKRVEFDAYSDTEEED